MGLRESLVTLSGALESQGRRLELALTTEGLRVSEEVGSLKAIVQGLRMQVSLGFSSSSVGSMAPRTTYLSSGRYHVQVYPGAPGSACLWVNPISLHENQLRSILFTPARAYTCRFALVSLFGVPSLSSQFWNLDFESESLRPVSSLPAPVNSGPGFCTRPVRLIVSLGCWTDEGHPRYLCARCMPL